MEIQLLLRVLLLGVLQQQQMLLRVLLFCF